MDTLKAIFVILICLSINISYSQAYWIYLQGEEYYSGNSTTPQNFERAFFLFEESARMGCPMAEEKMGTCYYLGHGVTQSYRKAFHWTKRAAKHGIASSQYQLGYMFFWGEGCQKSANKAYKWFYRAADRGDTTAIDFLQQFSLYIHRKYVWSDTTN